MDMAQSRICSYLKPVCKHASREPTTFLSLPEHIRHQVYLHAEIITDALMSLMVEDGVHYFSTKSGDIPATVDLYANLYSIKRDVPLTWSTNDHGFQPDEVHPYVNVRLVSRDVNADVVKYLCFNNYIMLDKADILDNALGVSVKWPFSLLQWLRRLIIVLDDSIGDRIWGWRLHKTLIYTPTSKKFKKFQPAWDKLIRLLESSPNCSKVELKLACNVEDANSARLLLQPLEQLQVAKCTIQLTGKHNLMLENIAREAVLRSTIPNIYAQGSFRFLDLPTELRQHILSYTDLVTPFREIIWSPIRNFELNDTQRRANRPCSNHGFCTTQSFVFPVCACWQSPISMFLVCQTMLQDARTIFYTSNRFIIVPPRSFAIVPTFRKERRFEASIFLTQVVPSDSLASLRDLEIVFPGKDYSHLGISQRWLDDWEKTIRYTAPRLKKLTLSLYMGYEYGRSFTFYTGDHQKSLQALFRVHEQIVRPLDQLQCLDGLYIKAWSCFDHDEVGTRTTAQQYFRQHAKNLEAAVMGSTYDSERCGKLQRRDSKWLSDG